MSKSARSRKSLKKQKSAKRLPQPKPADEVFNLLDLNNDGSVSSSELEKALRYWGLNPVEGETDKMIEKFNPENPGYLSRKEFADFFEEHKADLEKQLDEMKEAFRVLDKDNSGTISAKELRVLMRKHGTDMGESEINELITLVDQNGDGVLDVDEFATLLCTLEGDDDEDFDDDMDGMDGTGAMMGGTDGMDDNCG